MSAQALALELHRTAQARQPVESPLSVTAKQLFARKVRRDEQRPQHAAGFVTTPPLVVQPSVPESVRLG